MAIVQVRKCDYQRCPKRDETVQPFEIRFPEGVIQPDLCPDHAKALRALRDRLADVKMTPPRAPRRLTSRSTAPADPDSLPKDL